MATSIALVGPGAIGSTVAALLDASGHQVAVCGRTACDALDVRPDPDILDGEPIVVPGPVRADPETIEDPVDVVLLAVKDTQNRNAAAWLARPCDANTVVCVMQNGVEQVGSARQPRSCPAPCGSPPRRSRRAGAATDVGTSGAPG